MKKDHLGFNRQTFIGFNSGGPFNETLTSMVYAGSTRTDKPARESRPCPRNRLQFVSLTSRGISMVAHKYWTLDSLTTFLYDGGSLYTVRDFVHLPYAPSFDDEYDDVTSSLYYQALLDVRAQLRSRADDTLGSETGEFRESVTLVENFAKGLLETYSALRQRRIPRWAVMKGGGKPKKTRVCSVIKEPPRAALSDIAGPPKMQFNVFSGTNKSEVIVLAKQWVSRGLGKRGNQSNGRFTVTATFVAPDKSRGTSPKDRGRPIRFYTADCQRPEISFLSRADKKATKRKSCYSIIREAPYTLNDLSASWVQLHFATLPLMGSTFKVVDKLSNAPPPPEFIRKSSEQGLDRSFDNSSEWESWGFKTDVHYSVKVRAYAVLYANHKPFNFENPAVWVWNAIPYSFVVDWFTNVGSYLETFTALNSYADAYGSVTVKQTVRTAVYDKGWPTLTPFQKSIADKYHVPYYTDVQPGEYESLLYSRTPLRTIPTPPLEAVVKPMNRWFGQNGQNHEHSRQETMVTALALIHTVSHAPLGQGSHSGYKPVDLSSYARKSNNVS